MSVKMAMESFTFDGETIGAAGGQALRKIRSLTDQAPTGRLFAAIATLAEMSDATTRALESGNLQRATAAAHTLSEASAMTTPDDLRKKA